MVKTAKSKSGRPRRDAREKIHKVRSFRVRPSLDRMLLVAAKESGRSVSEEIERALDRSADSTALLNMLLGERPADAVRLLGLITRAMQMPSFADWATNEEPRALLKATVNLLIDAVARGEFTDEQFNAAPRETEAESNARLAAFVLFNPREQWIRPASAEVRTLMSRDPKSD